MTRRGWVSAAAALLLAMGAAVTIDGSGAAASGPGLRFFDPDGDWTELSDIGSPGLSPGDTVLENHPLRSVTNSRTVGSVITAVRVVRTFDDGDFLAFIDCTVRVDGRGSLTFVGGIRFTDAQAGTDLPVVGGTGRWAGTRGTVHLTVTEVGGVPGGLLEFSVHGS